MLRPIFLDYEDDVKAWEPSNDFMLGDALLVASVAQARAGGLRALHLAVLVLSVAVPNLVALRHRRRGWLNQPSEAWP